jgi:hypothetical protein
MMFMYYCTKACIFAVISTNLLQNVRIKALFVTAFIVFYK